MLERLSIKNIALIDSIDIDFYAGLNVLSGETGAGKSIIVDALGLLRGKKSNRMLIGKYAEDARVEGVFDISSNALVKSIMNELELEYDEGTLILTRQIYSSGRSVCKANMNIIPLSTLKLLGGSIVDIHGQHEHQALFDQNSQMNMLDRFGGSEINVARGEMVSCLVQYKEKKKKLVSMFGSDAEREQRADFLRYQIKEIEGVNPSETEEEELISTKNRMLHAEKILKTYSNAYDLLYDGMDEQLSALNQIDQAVSSFKDIVDLDQEFATVANKLENTYYVLEEIAYEVRDKRAEFEFDQDIMEQTNQRLDAITRLKRKYGSSLKEVLDFYNKSKIELEQIENSEHIREQLLKECKNLESQLFEYCNDLHKHRKKWAKKLVDEIGIQLCELGLKNAKFDISIEAPTKEEFPKVSVTDKGFDDIEFIISTNLGQELMPLAKIVSGGEASRIMLALKTIIAELDDIDSLVFDEVDAGLSGHMAHVVARKLGAISRERQILCITHLPQIAAMGDIHYLIEKHDENNKTKVFVNKLDDESMIKEIARLSGGGNNQLIAFKHAKEIKTEASQFKNKML